MDVDLDPRVMVRELDASYKQIVEIARALLMEASIIIMDEPTPSLTGPEKAQELRNLFKIVQEQHAKNKRPTWPEQRVQEQIAAWEAE